MSYLSQRMREDARWSGPRGEVERARLVALNHGLSRVEAELIRRVPARAQAREDQRRLEK